MFEFTELIGQVYRGQWTASDTFTITIDNANNAGPPVVGVTTVTPIGTTPILSADETSDASSSTSPVLIGDFGVLFFSPPVITSLVVDDPDDLDDVYSIDDTITITFDSDTDTPGGTGIQSKLFVDDLFTFTVSIGSQYRGQWTASDAFTITINGVNNAALVLGTTTVTPTGTTLILSADGTSAPSSATSPVLSGDFGAPPFTNPWSDGGSGIIHYTGGNVGIGTTIPTHLLSVDGIIESTSGGFMFPDGTIQSTARSGDITEVTAGVGLLGGGTTGDVTLDVNTGIIQNRVIGSCSVGSSISAINSDGSVVCELDDMGSITQTRPIYMCPEFRPIDIDWEFNSCVGQIILDNTCQKQDISNDVWEFSCTNIGYLVVGADTGSVQSPSIINGGTESENGGVIIGDRYQWIYCAAESNTCSFSGEKTVRYGKGSTWVYGTFTNSVSCSNSVFGDPLQNVAKECYYEDVI